jgi:transposase
MEEYSEVFVGLDTSKLKISVAVADGERNGEVRFFGEISAEPASVASLVAKLAKRGAKLHFCYEAGPTGYDLHRQITGLGHDCEVVAPSLIPRRPGNRVKTNRRDAVSLARLHRAGELTSVWVAFIAKHRSVWPVAWLCEALDVSRSGFHAWLGRRPSLIRKALESLRNIFPAAR